MLDNFIVVLGQVGALFVMMAFGFFLRKSGRFSDQTIDQMSFVLLYFASPLIIVDKLQIDFDRDVFYAILIGLLLCVGYYIVCGLASLLFWRKQPPDTRDTLRSSSVFPNCGFMGVPLASAVYGASGMIYFIPVLACFNIMQWILCVAFMGGRKEVSLRKAVINPGVISVLVGLFLYVTGLRLPTAIGSAVTHIGNLNTPLAMLVIGAQMARTNFLEAFKNRALYLMSLLKLLVFPLFFALLLYPLPISSELYQVLVLLSACPPAATNAIFAQKYKRDTGTAAQGITLATLLSALTLPLVAAILKTIA